MSTSVLPMLFINLGGEMLYVLDQRLRAQNVSLTKGKKVMAEIVGTMFNKSFVEELFKAQPMYSKNAMRTMFDRLVHSSIMRVDTDSMDKLFDLMIMAMKYQIVRCPSPKDLLHVALNHLDAIMQFVSSSSDVKKVVTEVFLRTVDFYSGMTIGELVMVRQALLKFLQDSRNKVSIFINTKSQNFDGSFVIPKHGNVPVGTDVPGRIILHKQTKKEEIFSTGCKFCASDILESVSVDIGGTRSTKLGTNLYANDYNYEQMTEEDSYQTSSQNLAKAELKLLGHLMGTKRMDNEEETFKLDLFNTKTDTLDMSKTTSASQGPAHEQNVVTIKATKSGGEQLTQIMNDFSITSKPNDTSDDDLLALMDNF